MYRAGFQRNKYGAIRQTYNNYNYDSKFEAQVAAELDLRVKAKDIKSWERQFTVEIISPITGNLICKHRVDFRLLLNDGSYELLEAKGVETEGYRLKRKLLEEIWLPQNLDHVYNVVKQKSWRAPRFR